MPRLQSKHNYPCSFTQAGKDAGNWSPVWKTQGKGAGGAQSTHTCHTDLCISITTMHLTVHVQDVPNKQASTHNQQGEQAHCGG